MEGVIFFHFKSIQEKKRIEIVFLISQNKMAVFAQAVLIIKVLVSFTKPKLPTMIQMIMSFLQVFCLLQIWSLREFVITA